MAYTFQTDSGVYPFFHPFDFPKFSIVGAGLICVMIGTVVAVVLKTKGMLKVIE
jgi:hypothetical protein